MTVRDTMFAGLALIMLIAPAAVALKMDMRFLDVTSAFYN